MPLESAPADFLELAAQAFERIKGWEGRFTLGQKLHVLDSARFGPAVERLATDHLLAEDTRAQARLWQQASRAATWLATNRWSQAQAALKRYFAAPIDTAGVGFATGGYHAKYQSQFKNEALDQAAVALGRPPGG